MNKGPVAGVILAAGESRRWGSPKPLLLLEGRPLVTWTVDAALASALSRVILVLGRDRETVVTALADRGSNPRLEVVFNPRFAEGQATSLTVGLQALEERFGAAMFLLGDQPLVTSTLIDSMLAHFATTEKGICVPVCAGRRGNPVLFDRSFYPDLLALSGDEGGRGIIAAHPEAVLAMEIDDPAVFWDIDAPGDLDRVLRHLAERRRAGHCRDATA